MNVVISDISRSDTAGGTGGAVSFLKSILEVQLIK
jgi:hypothetical protein